MAETVVDPAAAGAEGTTATVETTPVSGPSTAVAALEGAHARLNPVSPAGGGTVQPPAGAQPVTVPAKPGPDAGIAQLRTAYEDTKRKLQVYEGMDAEEARIALAQWKRFSSDPLSYYKQLGSELGAHPDFKDKLTPKVEEPEPQPDMYTVVNGEKHLVYSATQLAKWRDWNNQKLMGQVEEKLNPMQSWVEKAQESAEQNAVEINARETTTRVMAEMRKYPHFTVENEPKIAALLAQIPRSTKKAIGAVGSLFLAYQTFLKSDVFPTLEAETRKKVEADYARKAAASSGNVKPGGGGAGATGKSPTNPKSLAEKMASGAYSK